MAPLCTCFDDLDVSLAGVQLVSLDWISFCCNYCSCLLPDGFIEVLNF